MTIAIAPRQPAPQQQESFGAKMGTAVGEGLNQLIESKVNDLNRQRGIKERKSTYAKAGLPEWLGELPDDFQQLFLKEFDFASPQEKEQIRQGVEQLGEQYYSPAQPGDDMEDEEQDQQQGMLPGQMMQGQQMPQQPQGQAAGVGLAGLQAQQMGMQQQERQIPGMNKLAQAGQGFQEEPRGAQEPQSFPRLGKGTNGAPSPVESMQPAQKEPQFTRKGKNSAKAVEKGLTAAQSLKLEQDTQKKSEAKKHVQKAYDRVKEILDTGYTGFSFTGLSPEGRQQRAEMDTLGEIFLANFIPLVNPKGTMSKQRFEYIQSKIPSSWDMDATIKGKLDALKEIFELEDHSTEKSSSPDSSGQPPQELVSASPEDTIFYDDGVAKFIKKNGKLERV